MPTFSPISLTTSRSSTGVLMWEVYSEGRLPYDNRTNAEVVESLNAGHRLLKPRLASDAIYPLMEWCWKEVSSRCSHVRQHHSADIFSFALSLTETWRPPLLQPSAAWAGLHLLTVTTAAVFSDNKLSHIYLIYWVVAICCCCQTNGKNLWECLISADIKSLEFAL